MIRHEILDKASAETLRAVFTRVDDWQQKGCAFSLPFKTVRKTCVVYE